MVLDRCDFLGLFPGACQDPELTFPGFPLLLLMVRYFERHILTYCAVLAGLFRTAHWANEVQRAHYGREFPLCQRHSTAGRTTKAPGSTASHSSDWIIRPIRSPIGRPTATEIPTASPGLLKISLLAGERGQPRAVLDAPHFFAHFRGDGGSTSCCADAPAGMAINRPSDRLRTRPDESAEVVIRRNIVSPNNDFEPDVDNIFTLAHPDRGRVRGQPIGSGHSDCREASSGSTSKL